MTIDIQVRSQQTDQTDETSSRSINTADVTPKPSLPIRIFYRTRQFVRGVTAHVSADEMLIAAQILPKAALAHFCQMPLDAQRHSLNVLYMLQEAGWGDADLAAAALLHDVGKSASDDAGISLNPWLRSTLTALEALIPEQVHRLAKEDPALGWRYLLHVHKNHPRIGADWAAQAGCSELTCWLIEHHQDDLQRPFRDRSHEFLAMLQWADDRN